MTQGTPPSRVYDPKPSKLEIPDLDGSQGAGLGTGLAVSLGVPAGVFLMLFLGMGFMPMGGATLLGPLLFGIGLTQLLWLVPVGILAHVRKRAGVIKGLAIGGGIVFMLNALCFGLVFMALGGGLVAS